MMTATPDRTLNYAFLLGGITALIFGIILLVRTEAAIGIVALLLGLWWLIQGAFLVFSVFVDRTNMWWKLFVGLIGLTAGIVVLANPVQSGEFLGSAMAVVLGVLGLLSGIVSIIGGLKGGGAGAIVFGIFTAGIGLLLLFFPDQSFNAMVTVLAFILMVEGIASIALAIIAKPDTPAVS